MVVVDWVVFYSLHRIKRYANKPAVITRRIETGIG